MEWVGVNGILVAIESELQVVRVGREAVEVTEFGEVKEVLRVEVTQVGKDSELLGGGLGVFQFGIEMMSGEEGKSRGGEKDTGCNKARNLDGNNGPIGRDPELAGCISPL